MINFNIVMSNLTEKHKKLAQKKIKIKYQNIRYSTLKENETDIKIKKIINFLYLDKFQEILIIPKSQYMQNIENKLEKIISENYPEYITIKKSYIDTLKKDINNRYTNEYTLIKKTINNFAKNPKLFKYITNFIPHCQKCDKYAYHNCTTSLLYGKFIKIIDFVICVECKKCYKSDLIEMYCKYCKKIYYSSINVDNNKNAKNINNTKNLPFATWEKYHCGFIINEIMKCIKCKSKFHYDSISNKLICLNKNCKFEVKPKSIIWKCSICSSEFISPVKAYNPLEIKIYKNSINYALIIREKAHPYKVQFCNFCGGDISKETFYHKKECGGELLMSKLNNKEVVVCSRCHGMNFYSQYSWTCPFCDKKIKNKNYFNLIKDKENSFNKNISENKNKINEKFLLSYDNKNNNINEFKAFSNLKLSKKKNLLLSPFEAKTYNNKNTKITSDNSKINISCKNKSNQSNQSSKKTNDLKIQKKSSFFTIKNLFMRNDSKEKNKIKINLKSKINNKISNSLEKSVKKKSTLFDILQKRCIQRTLSVSKDKKDLSNNNLSNTINKHYSYIEINKTNRLKYTNKKIVPYRFSLIDKNVCNKTENNLSIRSFNQKKQNDLIKNEKNEKIKRIIYQKNVAENVFELNEKIEKVKPNHVYKSIKYLNNIKNYSLYDNEKEKQIQKRIEFKNKIKEELEDIRNNEIINQNFVGRKIFEKSRYDENEKNDEKQIQTKLFRKTYNKFSNANINKNPVIKNEKNNINKEEIKDKKENIKNIIYHNIYPLEKNKIQKLKRNIRPVKTIMENKNKNELMNNYKKHYSKTTEKPENNRKFEYNKNTYQISPKREIDTNDKKMSKTMSKRRFYQSLTKSTRENNNRDENNYISNFDDNLNVPLKNSKSNKIIDKKTPISEEITEKNHFNQDKGFNIINTNSNTNYNTNNDKTNNIKDNNNDSQANIDFIDFENEQTNIISDSRINSLINNDIENNNLLYDPFKIEELIQNCKIPKFETEDYIYQKSIGEGSYGTIFEVEEIKTGNKYAIKKIICKDFQELIKQKAQLELAYSIEHENIMKIYKVQIKSLDFTTYSISALMELAISDWDNEIIKRAKDNNYYKEKELISIFKQLINGLLFLKNKNIGHRDIKPQNILIFPKNVFKLTDLGEAKNINNLKSLRTLKGCELYMSPALYFGLLHGKKNLAHNIYKSDVFSLGYCFLYAINLNIKILEKIRKLNNNDDIRNIIINSINNNIYSDNFLDIIYKMIDINEEQRYDFEDLFNEIEKLDSCI